MDRRKLSYRYKAQARFDVKKEIQFRITKKYCQTLKRFFCGVDKLANMQPVLSHGVGGQPPTQSDGYIMGGPGSMQAGAASAASLTPGVYIYGQTPGANTILPGQPAGTYGLNPAFNAMHPNQVNWNSNHMYYQQHRYFSRYRWQLFVAKSRHRATVWHRVRFVQPKTFCPECFTPRVIESDDEESESKKAENNSQGSPESRQCVR